MLDRPGGHLARKRSFLMLRGSDFRSLKVFLVRSLGGHSSRCVYRTYQHVGETHLHRYLVEFDSRYNRKKLGVDDAARAGPRVQSRCLNYENNSRGGRERTV